jgi:hypothetical protein
VNPCAIAFESLEIEVELFQLPRNEVLCPAGGGDDAVGHGLTEFGFGSACFLRDREVLLESGGAADGNSTAYPDQFGILGFQHFFILEVEDLLARLHGVFLL